MPESTSSVRREFFLWADQALSAPIPDSAVAFHFNLYEGIDSVHVQLIGTESFFAGDVPERDYWPGKEAFTTGEEIFEIQFAVAGADWQQWLTTSMEIIRSYIESGGRSSVLRASRGVGVGFVDGDMHVLWQPEDP